jgi:hypothetical protein
MGSNKVKLPVNYDELPISDRKKVREAYIKKQDGLCYFCKQSLKEEPSEKIKNIPIHKWLFPEGFFNYPVHLHHSHDTGMTIGSVHCYCNAILWQYYGE